MMEWVLILSVTSVSVTMMMMVGTFLAIIPQTMLYYSVTRTAVVLLASIFNIGYVVMAPFIFFRFNNNYFAGIILATVVTGGAAIGRYLAGPNYMVSLGLTIVVAIAHIMTISAPYGLLKLFPSQQKGCAASIPIFLPYLGMNFSILYGMAYIANGSSQTPSIQQIHSQIDSLNLIIAIFGTITASVTVALVLFMRESIESEDPQVHVPASLCSSLLMLMSRRMVRMMLMSRRMW